MYKFLKTISHLIASLIAIICLNFWNIFDYVKFIPEEYRYDTGVTIYFSIAEILIGYVLIAIKKKCFADIEVIVKDSKSAKTKGDLLYNPTIVLDNQFGLSEFTINIKVNGSYDNLKNVKICIPHNHLSTMQIDLHRDYVLMDENNDCNVMLDKWLDNSSKYIESNISFKISLIKDVDDTNETMKVEPECKYIKNNLRRFLINFKKNYMTLQVERSR